MEVLRGLGTDRAAGPTVTTIGTFDAVHKGHQALFAEVCRSSERFDARPTVLTFDRHPLEVLAPEKAPCRLATLDQRLERFSEHGISTTLVLPFTRELANIEPEAFVSDILVDQLRVRAVVVGADFRFGHDRRGDVSMMQDLGRDQGFEVHDVQLVGREGGPIHSTTVRRLVREGEVEEAAELLGRDHRLAGTVVRGKGRGGSELGFPTANLEVAEGTCLPGLGVYAGRFLWEGRSEPAAISVGIRPTFTPDPEPVIEAYLLDFSGDLYGVRGEIEFVARLRDELRFESVDDLVAQMHTDVSDTRRRLGA